MEVPKYKEEDTSRKEQRLAACVQELGERNIQATVPEFRSAELSGRVSSSEAY